MYIDMTPQNLNIQEWARLAAHYLRKNPDRYNQILGEWSDFKDGRCALGKIASEMEGWDGDTRLGARTRLKQEMNVILQNAIAGMNDSGKYTFGDLADILDEVANDPDSNTDLYNALPAAKERAYEGGWEKIVDELASSVKQKDRTTTTTEEKALLQQELT